MNELIRTGGDCNTTDETCASSVAQREPQRSRMLHVQVTFASSQWQRVPLPRETVLTDEGGGESECTDLAVA